MSTHSLLYFVILALTCSGGASATPFRRFLHQPLLLPLDSFPPSASPQPQPEPPFSSATPQTQLPPFFPSTAVTPTPPNPPPPPPPPPPPSPYLITFPANISALLLPTSPSSSNLSSSHRRRASVIVSITLLSVALLFALSALILIHRRNRNAAGFSSDKSSHPDGLRLVPPNTCSSSDAVPLPSVARPPRYASTSSSEFLNPGAHSSSNHFVDVAQEEATAGVHSSTSAQTSYPKLGSPELRPLPPLPRVPTHWSGETISFYNKNEGTKKEEDRDDNGEDEFFSPRGSSSHRGSTGSPDLRPALNPLRGSEFLSLFGSRSLNSRNASYPYTAAMYGSSRNSTSSSGGNDASLQMDAGSPEPVLKFLAPTNVSVSRAMPLNSPTLSSSTSSLQTRSEMHKFKTFTPTTPIIHPSRNLPPPPPPVSPRRFWENPISQDPIAWLPGALAGAPSEQRRSGSSENSEGTSRAKLKPLHRDKVRASSERTIVWDHIKSASFQLNEEMIENLFVANGSAQKENGRPLVLPLMNQENQVLDPKKSQNIVILLKALNVTVDEVCKSLMEGNVDSMGSELLKHLSKMAPTKEEEQRLVEFNDISPMNLGTGEMFLKALLDVPFAFKRVDAMLYIANFNAETEYLRRSFETLKAACGELRKSKLFLKLLEAVLKTGNRMNVGTNRVDARAFDLDTLLKLVDVKGKDGRTTLLHFVVQEISRIEGMELSKDNDRTHQSSLGLQVVSGLSGDLTNVKKAATMDSCMLSNEVAKLADGLMSIKVVLRMCCDERNDDSGSKFTESMRKFILEAGEEIASVQAEESAALSLVREVTEYFHGDSRKEEAHPFRIFLVVKDFLSILDRACKELGRIDEQSIYSSAVQFPAPADEEKSPPGRTTTTACDCLYVTESGY